MGVCRLSRQEAISAGRGHAALEKQDALLWEGGKHLQASVVALSQPGCVFLHVSPVSAVHTEFSAISITPSTCHKGVPLMDGTGPGLSKQFWKMNLKQCMSRLQTVMLQWQASVITWQCSCQTKRRKLRNLLSLPGIFWAILAECAQCSSTRVLCPHTSPGKGEPAFISKLQQDSDGPSMPHATRSHTLLSTVQFQIPSKSQSHKTETLRTCRVDSNARQLLLELSGNPCCEGSGDGGDRRVDT